MSERGSGSILAIAVLGAILAVMTLLIPLLTVLARREQLEGAADAAALAAADVAVGISPGIPCEIAGRVAEANGASSRRCQVDGVIVTVVLGGEVLGFPIAASATAGPPGV